MRPWMMRLEIFRAMLYTLFPSAMFIAFHKSEPLIQRFFPDYAIVPEDTAAGNSEFGKLMERLDLGQYEKDWEKELKNLEAKK